MNRAKKLAIGLFTLAVAVACGADADRPLPGTEILASFEPGAARTAVVEALPDGELSASPQIPETQIDHGYVVDDYLIDGQRIAVLWVHDASEGLPEGADPRSAVQPVVFVDDVLDGYGWAHYDRRVADWDLPDRWAGIPATAAPSEPGDADAGGASEVRSF